MLKPGKKMEADNDTKAGKVDVVAQELKFAKMLASNDSKTRSKILKSLKKWLKTRSQSSYHFTNNDFLRLWKGLYYCMWMSDKPLVQEELAEDLGSLVHCFPDLKVGIQFFRNFLETMCLEWFGIDQWRIDKFMMLVRRCFRQVLFALKNTKWEDEYIKLFADAMAHTVYQTHKCPKGLIMHICDFYVEEIAKVSDGDLAEERVFLFIEPFMVYYTKLNDQVLLLHVEKNIFNQLLYQSELGQEYQEKFDIWKQANFPTRSIDDIEVNYKVRENKSFNDDDLSDGQEEDEEERALDPRAGRVDVIMNEVKFDAMKIAETMENFRYKTFATGKSRKGLARMAGKFRKFCEEVFPLGIGRLPRIGDEDDSDIDLDLKAMELAEFEKKLAIGDVDSDSSSSDFDEDLDNRKHGKLKRKSKEETTTKASKTAGKKQKLSKLHNERFFKDDKDPNEDFTKENSPQNEDDEELTATEDVKKSQKLSKKKNKKKLNEDEAPRKIKKRKSLPTTTVTKAENEDEICTKNDNDDDSSVDVMKPKKSLKSHRNSSPSSTAEDEWSEPLKEGEVEYFLPSRKQKLKALREEAGKSDSDLVLNPFAKHTGSSVSSKKVKTSKASSTTTPRIQLQPSTSGSTGKRVIIALNKNKAQSPHEYIKQVLESPNLPYDSNKKPTKSLLKPNAIPSPINPFYQKKIGLKLNFNDTM